MAGMDDRTPLLTNGSPPTRAGRVRRVASNFCSVDSWRRRLPITIWLPQYTWSHLFRDAIAGITVGLTSVPQGIAYAIVAGLPPQVGLYSSIFPGYVYMLFCSCKDVTVGPTAILSALLAKYVAQSVDFAYLAAFLSGCVIMLLGVLQLGFLLDFISKPVISGFTTAAALQIASSQLKSLFRVSGKSGNTCLSALINFFKNIKTIQPWDTLLGLSSIAALYALKRVKIPITPNDQACRIYTSHTFQYMVRARNAIVVFGATIVAYALFVRDITPFALTGKIDGGLPHFAPPPFSTVVNNKTLNFEGMLEVFGAEGLVMPLVAILESIAIAKAFAGSASVDATQEMIAVGACNIISSFCQSMPATGSFTRTALNHASGVLTPAGSFFKATLVLLAVTLLADSFYFIPRATLAAVIMVAMVSLMEVAIIKMLWRNSKIEFLIYSLTVVIGISMGLEYGILAGALGDALRALGAAARPKLLVDTFKVGHLDCLSIILLGKLSYACAEHVPQRVRRHASTRPAVVVLDARHLHTVDIGVAENLISVILDLEKQQYRFLLWKFNASHQQLFEEISPGFKVRFVNGPSIDQYVLGLEIDRRSSNYNTF